MNVWLDVLATEFPVRCPALIIFKKKLTVYLYCGVVCECQVRLLFEFASKKDTLTFAC